MSLVAHIYISKLGKPDHDVIDDNQFGSVTCIFYDYHSVQPTCTWNSFEQQRMSK